MTILFLCLLLSIRITLLLSLEHIAKSKWALKNRHIQKSANLKTREQENKKWPLGFAIDIVCIYLLLQINVLSISAGSLKEFGVLLFSHCIIVESLYYGYHRLLHLPFLFQKHHYMHHLAYVTYPKSAFIFTLAERISYTLLFAIPLVIASYVQSLSWVGIFSYILVIDTLNALGHLNVKILASWHQNSWLKYLIYSPQYHHLHHTKIKGNYSLFMPIYDFIFKSTLEES